MPEPYLAPLLQVLSSATGVAVNQPGSQVAPCTLAQNTANDLNIGTPAVATVPDGHYMLARFGRQPTSVVAAVPHGLPGDSFPNVPMLDAASEERLRQALQNLIVAMGRVIEAQRSTLEMSSQIKLVSKAVIAIASDLDLESVLRRIVDLARDIAGAKYGAVGIPNPDGELKAFITSGLTSEQEAQIGEAPRGLGILGLLMGDPRTLRVANLSQHPASIGFPANHRLMESFLGVPVQARGRKLGSPYLTEKLFGSGFTEEDARMVELLARHAGVAIENAELFQTVVSQEHRLQQVIDQLSEAKKSAQSAPYRITSSSNPASTSSSADIGSPGPIRTGPN